MKFYDAQFKSPFFDPIVITVLLWIFVFVGSMFSALDDWQTEAFIFIATGIFFHLFGLGICRLVHSSFSREAFHGVVPVPVALSVLKRGLIFRMLLSNFFFVLMVAAFVFFIVAYLNVVPSMDTKGLLIARNMYLDEAKGLSDKLFIYTTHFTLLGIVAMYFTGCTYLIKHESRIKGSAFLFNIISLVTFFVALLTTGRTAPLLVLFFYAFYSYRFRVHSEQVVLGSAGLFVFLMFFGVAFALGKEGLGDSKSIDIGEAFFNLGRVYFFSAPLAMQDVYLNALTVSDACSNIFAYPIDLLRKFGLFESCGPKTLDFVFVPVATNVFTFVRAYWEDFGWAFPFAMFVSGVIVEFVYARSFLQPNFYVFIYPFFLNSVVLQIFEEQLFANGSVFLYLVFFYIVFKVCFDFFVGKVFRPR